MMDEIDKLDAEYDWIFQLMLQNFELKRRIKGLLLRVENLQAMIKKEHLSGAEARRADEENKEPLPLNLDEIFSEK